MEGIRYHFTPGLAATVATALLLPLLLGLGIWQLQRADQKRALQAEYDQRSAGPAIALDARLRPAEELRYYRVMAQGYYDDAWQILQDNRVHNGRVGYEVLTPLRLAYSETRVLVNRGWLPLGPDRNRPPAIDPPAGLQRIEGVAVLPARPGLVLGELEPVSARRPAVWQYVDLGRYARSVPFPVQSVVLLLDPTSPAGGYERDWGRLDTGISIHLGYAFQWFSLAGALIVLYVVVNFRREPSSKPTRVP